MAADTRRRPAPPATPLDRARAHVAAGQMREAFDLFETLLDAARDRDAIRAEFGWFLTRHTPARPHPAVDDVLILALDECWVRAETLAVPVARYLAAKWPGAMLGGDASGFVADPLLHALLRATPAATPALDMLLARLRHAALRIWAARGDLTPLAPFLAALAVRADHSGYASTLPEGEGEGAEASLVATLAQHLAGDVRVLSTLALYATYAPLRRDWLEAGDAELVALRDLMDARDRCAMIADALEPATAFDSTTGPVAEQYETHPYPAWVAEPRSDIALPRVVAKALGPAGRGAVRSVLVAGCGTGQHAVAATCRWPRAQVLAIDASRTSLAYAIDRTRGLDLPLTFALADLLRVGDLDRQFDAVEAVGVLHHLDDPAAGLAALRAVLAPGGVMLIGLYAAAARSRLAAARAVMPVEGTATDDDIRRYRARMLLREDMVEITYSPDFYSIGGVRDLVFHVREQAYALPDVAALLEAGGMVFLTLEPPPWAAAMLEAVPAANDLTAWHMAETTHPTLFGGMYQIWARRPN